ncbi:MAG: c-type cytochrome domain-containing protein [Mariniblastus sp.]
MTTSRRLISIAATLVLAIFSSTVTAQDKVDFVKQIKPIFEKHCIGCHGPEEEEAFRIDDREATVDYYIEPGEPDESDLYASLISDDEEELMPPPGEENPLSAAQISLVKTWIEQGADWPEGVTMKAASIKVDDGGDDKKDGESEDGKETVNDVNDKKTQQVFNAIGSLHPAAIHLPIGLLLASGLFAFFSLRGNFVMSDCAYYCLWLGTIGAIIACATGWWFSPMENRGEVGAWKDLFDQTQPVFWHRTGGLIVTAVAFLLALFAAGARSRDPDDGITWKLGLIVLAFGIGWVGHTGGELHYGEGHYEDLNGLWNDLVSPEGDAKIPIEKKDEVEDDESMIGKASGEGTDI